MAIYSDLELERIMNEAGIGDAVRVAKDTAKSRVDEMKDNIKDHLLKRKKSEKEDDKDDDVSLEGVQTFNFVKDNDGNIVNAYTNEEAMNEFFNTNINNTKIAHSTIQLKNKAVDTTTDLKLNAEIEKERQRQEWAEKPVEKTATVVADTITGGSAIRGGAKLLGRTGDKLVDKIKKKVKDDRKNKTKAVKESAEVIYRSPEFNKVMNEYFDITDTETRRMLLAVNEADQSKVLVSLTTKLYDNVIDKVDDIDFGEIPATKGDITKLPNFTTMTQCLDNMKNILIEFKQDTKPVDTISESIACMVDLRDIWTKAYAVNVELPMITYNTMTLAIIEATSYLVALCVEFIKSPSQDTMQTTIDRSALTKSKQHLTFKNLESFNSSCNKGQVRKAMTHVLDQGMAKKNFVGTVGVGVATVGIIGLLFCIIPIIRELIFLFYYYRVRVSEFFDVQADMLQVNAYNIENNRLDLTKEERKSISNKQLKTADRFRKVAQTIEIKGKTAEKEAVKESKKESSKKYKAEEIMDELPDSAASSSSLF